jgi:hypothetical protein
VWAAGGKVLLCFAFNVAALLLLFERILFWQTRCRLLDQRG